MQKDLLLELIRKYRRGEATPDERRLLEAYYESFEVRAEATEAMTEADRALLAREIRRQVSAGPESPRLPHRMKMYSRAVAAMLLLAAGIAYLGWKGSLPQGEVRKNGPASAAVANNFVELPDGSTVILSPGSKLDFSRFTDRRGKREVYLTGEGYFDVKPDPKRPFIVYAGQIQTAVLGTSFNVKAMPGDKSITVTVTSGKVQVGDEKQVFGVLMPDEQMVYYLQEARTRVEAVDGKASVNWKMGDLYCDDITVEQAVLHLQEKYGVSIEVMDQGLKNKRFTTTFGKDEPLESVLNSLALFNGAEYHIDAKAKVVRLMPGEDPEKTGR